MLEAGTGFWKYVTLAQLLVAPEWGDQSKSAPTDWDITKTSWSLSPLFSIIYFFHIALRCRRISVFFRNYNLVFSCVYKKEIIGKESETGMGEL